jgi:hypothetical protein
MVASDDEDNSDQVVKKFLGSVESRLPGRSSIDRQSKFAEDASGPIEKQHDPLAPGQLLQGLSGISNDYHNQSLRSWECRSQQMMDLDGESDDPQRLMGKCGEIGS